MQECFFTARTGVGKYEINSRQKLCFRMNTGSPGIEEIIKNQSGEFNSGFFFQQCERIAIMRRNCK